MVSRVHLFAETLAGEYAAVGYLYELVPISREDDRFGVTVSVLAFPSYVRNGRLHFPPVNDLVVLTAVLYDSLWLININEHNKRRNGYPRSQLNGVETDQARKESEEIMDLNHGGENKIREQRCR
ncbi:hypothetical protein TNCV_143301 [Trichonephila clavipes]|nr:hypothetical protein TNCV_143301 [Trichonephila clavipes]